MGVKFIYIFLIYVERKKIMAIITKLRGLTPLTKSILMTLIYLVMGFSAYVLPIMFGVTWFFTRKIDQVPWSSLALGISKKALRSFGIALSLTAVIVFLGSAISRYLLQDSIYHIPSSVGPTKIALSLVMAFVVAFLMQGFPEELVFRGYLVQTLSTKYNQLTTMILSVGLFTAIHATHLVTDGFLYGCLTMFYAFSFACLAYLLKFLFQTTWAAVAVHGGVHLTRMLLMFFGFAESNQAIFIQGILLLLVSLALLYTLKDQLAANTRITKEEKS